MGVNVTERLLRGMFMLTTHPVTGWPHLEDSLSTTPLAVADGRARVFMQPCLGLLIRALFFVPNGNTQYRIRW
jgi:hypothetical protein